MERAVCERLEMELQQVLEREKTLLKRIGELKIQIARNEFKERQEQRYNELAAKIAEYHAKAQKQVEEDAQKAREEAEERRLAMLRKVAKEIEEIEAIEKAKELEADQKLKEETQNQ